MEKAVAYLFGNDVIGSVKLSGDDSCILIEADIKGVDDFGYSICVVDLDVPYELIVLPSPCKRRVRVCFYIDCFELADMCGMTIVLNDDSGSALADGTVMKVLHGKRYYSEGE